MLWVFHPAEITTPAPPASPAHPQIETDADLKSALHVVEKDTTRATALQGGTENSDAADAVETITVMLCAHSCLMSC